MIAERAAEIFLEAQTRDPETRAEFVANICGEDAALAREVWALLEVSDDAGDYFEKLAGKVSLQTLANDAEPELIDQVVGSWKLLRRIGRGGMGVVYLAERADEQFEQQAALKLLPKGLDSDRSRARFLTERQILARLVHDNIARLLDGGVTEDGSPFFVMDYVEGLPIDEFCEQNDSSVDERLELILEIATAVQYAHRNLVIHRDLKPNNVLVTENREVRLLDFGIAKMLEPDRAHMSVTEIAQRPATPAYSSPEMLRGEPVDVTTDVYSIGVLSYVLLTGRLPIDYDGLSLAEMHLRASTEAPLPPSRLNPALDSELDAILVKALDKSPAERFPSVESFGNDIRSHLLGLPVSARAPSALYRARKFVGRHRVGTAFTTFAALALAAITGLALQFAVTSDRQAERIALERDRAESTKDFLVSIFEAADPEIAPGDQTALDILEAGRARIDAELANQPEVQADLLQAMSLVYGTWRLHDEGRDLLEQELELRSRIDGGRTAETSDVLGRLAEITDIEGDYDASLAYAKRALEISAAIGDRVGEARAHERIGRVAHLRGDYDEAEVRYRQSLSLLLDAGEEGGMAEALLREHLGHAMIDRERYEESVSQFQLALGIRNKFVSGDSADISPLYLGMGAALTSLDRFEEAQDYYLRGYEMNERLFGPDSSINLYFANGLGKVAEERGNLATAAQRFEEARALIEMHTPDSPNLVFALANIAKIEMIQNRYDSAIPVYRDAEAIASEKLASHWLLGEVRWRLGRCLIESGEFAEAERLILSGLDILKDSRGSDFVASVNARAAAALLYDRWGRPDEAAKYR